MIEVSKPQHYILTSSKPRNLFLAGAGSGKSHCIGLLTANYVINHPSVIQFIGANSYGQLSKSTLKRVFDVWFKEFGWVQDVNYVVDKIPHSNWPKRTAKLKNYQNTICFDNGAMIFTASMDNYKVIDGTEFGVAYLDETKDTKEEAVKEVIVARLRQTGLWKCEGRLISDPHKAAELQKAGKEIESHNPLYIFTTPAKVDWINKWFGLVEHYEEIQNRIFSRTDFFSKENDHQCVVISSTYHNLKNLPENYIDNLLNDYAGNDHLVHIFIYGSPIAKSGGEYLGNFSRIDHIKPVVYNKKAGLHLGFDFNVKPFTTGIVTQIEVDKEAKIIYWRFLKAYPSKGTKRHDNTEDLCNEILSDFGSHEGTVYYYGDSTGNNRNTATAKDDKHDFGIIHRVLFHLLNENSNRVVRNPSVKSRRDFMNKLFFGATFPDGYKVIIEIDPSCDVLIDDFEFCKQDKDGYKDKKEKNKDGSQKYGHMIDAAEGIAVGLFKEYFETLSRKY